MDHPIGRSRGSRARGFSLVELLVVAAIIAIMSAVALPNILAYLRGYRIQSAAQQLTQELATARMKAISRNVNLGVLLVVLAPGATGNPTTQVAFRWVVEDDMDPSDGMSAARRTLTFLLTPPRDAKQGGVLHLLPENVTITTAALTVPNGTYPAPNDRGIRFNRLGTMCDPGSDAQLCPAIEAGTNYVINLNAVTGLAQEGSTIVLRDEPRKLTRVVTVSPGGRVRVGQ